MPLHLLGKKSWNVYNTASVERVRRDEADARAREEAAELLMQEQDAERRMALLRGEEPPALPALPDESHDNDYADGRRRQRDEETAAPRERKRRRLKGEDDTEREMRYAREDVEAGSRAREAVLVKKSKGVSDAPLQDHNGHIQLVSAPDEKQARKSETAKDERASKRKKDEEEHQQHGMRFSDAAGYRRGTNKPWYAASDAPARQSDHKPTSELVLADLPGKDVWGNEDPRRVERERNRLVSSDPFAMMQQAQKQLKRSEGDREKWQAERDRELQQLKKEEERKRRHEKKHESRRRSRREQEHDDLEGFSLDGPARESGGDHARSDHDGHRRHRHSRRRRSRERSRSRSRENRRR